MVEERIMKYNWRKELTPRGGLIALLSGGIFPPSPLSLTLIRGETGRLLKFVYIKKGQFCFFQRLLLSLSQREYLPQPPTNCGDIHSAKERSIDNHHAGFCYIVSTHIISMLGLFRATGIQIHKVNAL
jgi:hypothetical protein